MSLNAETKTKDFDDFCEEWSLIAPQNGEEPIYFEDLDKALEACDQDTERLWTVVDGDGGSAWILAGNHIVNRLHMYFVTEEKHNFSLEDYQYWEPDEEDYFEET